MRYRHYKGGVYDLVCEAEFELDHRPAIVYRGQDGRTWVRPRDDFFALVEADGVRVARFTPLDPARPRLTAPRLMSFPKLPLTAGMHLE